MPKGGPRGGGRYRGLNALAAAALMAGHAARRGMVTAPVRGAGQARKARAAATRLGASVLRYRRRKPGLKIQNVKPTPGLTSHSMFKASRRPNRQVLAMKRVGAPNQNEFNTGVQTIASEGFQNAYCTSWFNQHDIQNMITKVPTGTVPPPGAYRTNRFVLESGICELLMTNSSLASCYVDIYDIARKRDANITEFAFTRDPLQAWIQGEFDTTQTNLDAYKFLKASPFDSQVFKDWFKVVKRTRIELSQGASHRHSVLLKPNKLVDAALPNFVDGDYAGLTMYTLVVFYGQPASVPQEGAPAIVTTAQIALDTVSTSRYKWTWVHDTTQQVYQEDNLSTLKGEQLVSTGAGAIVPNAIV